MLSNSTKAENNENQPQQPLTAMEFKHLELIEEGDIAQPPIDNDFLQNVERRSLKQLQEDAQCV